MSGIAEVSDSDFAKKVCGESGVVLVDFWAPWCGPCVALGAHLETIAQQYKGRLTVCKLNVQENQSSPLQYGVSALPTLVLFRNGAEISRIVGLNVQQLVSAIDEAVQAS